MKWISSTSAFARFVFFSGVAVMMVGLGAGCTSTRVGPQSEIRSTLVVAKAGDSVKLNWESKPGLLYTVVYSASLGANARWEPLPGYENMPGTGELMSAEDNSPGSETRYYRLHILQTDK